MDKLTPGQLRDLADIWRRYLDTTQSTGRSVCWYFTEEAARREGEVKSTWVTLANGRVVLRNSPEALAEENGDAAPPAADAQTIAAWRDRAAGLDAKNMTLQKRVVELTEDLKAANGSIDRMGDQNETLAKRVAELEAEAREITSQYLAVSSSQARLVDRVAELEAALRKIAGYEGEFSMAWPEQQEGYAVFAVMKARNTLKGADNG